MQQLVNMIYRGGLDRLLKQKEFFLYAYGGKKWWAFRFYKGDLRKKAHLISHIDHNGYELYIGLVDHLDRSDKLIGTQKSQFDFTDETVVVLRRAIEVLHGSPLESYEKYGYSDVYEP